MSIFDDLDIIPGLEAAFFDILQLNPWGVLNRIVAKKRPSSRRQIPALRQRSLMVLWQGLYDGFDSTRKGAWTTYWGTLPFGDHSGGGGWPGSGFSAFIYINAPRYKAGEDLLLDPPASNPNLITNGSFVGGYSPWSLGDPAIWYDGIDSIELHGATSSNPTLALLQGVSLTAGQIYRLTFDISNPSWADMGDGDALYFKVGDDDFDLIVDLTTLHDDQSLSYDIGPIVNDPDTGAYNLFIVSLNLNEELTFTLTNFSLVQL